ncbi:hypothetical protein JY651_15195 [Pyxidicoccus parkwayensis]|uniref:Uncharacterized protein n=1 Tax=Pyxidicoccus parkwayensis TaxID=2813578 RepID=A0ABX7P6W5_9BACT|nr:hypothetical protein [Pyxidicoccus parkwaysis]QSQ26192.1 hypothetical protein JY651_15195 [Pyxidicoccus parkwaysis]
MRSSRFTSSLRSVPTLGCESPARFEFFANENHTVQSPLARMARRPSCTLKATTRRTLPLCQPQGDDKEGHRDLFDTITEAAKCMKAHAVELPAGHNLTAGEMKYLDTLLRAQARS